MKAGAAASGAVDAATVEGWDTPDAWDGREEKDGEDLEMVYIVVVGLNKGVATGEEWEMSTLNEMCEMDSVSWSRVLPAPTSAHKRGMSLSCSWANFDLPSAGAGEETVVCCGREGARAGAGEGAWGGIALYYPKHLQEFHRLRFGVCLCVCVHIYYTYIHVHVHVYMYMCIYVYVYI